MRVFSRLSYVLAAFCFIAIRRGYSQLELSSSQDIVRALAEGGRRIAAQPYRRAVLVMGNKGVGKTTLIQWITGDNSKLYSAKSETTGEYTIFYNSTTKSKEDILHQQLTIDGDTQTAYYEVSSSFGDTRGLEYEIAEKYILNTLMKQVNSVKILLVVNYASVKTKVNDEDMTLLLTRVTNLINNSDQYLDGIGLIVTKVDDNNATAPGGLLNDDKKIVTNIKSNLNEYTTVLKQSSQAVSPINIKFYHQAGEIIYVLSLIVRENVALFRNPNQAGTLSEIRILLREKRKVQSMILKTLEYIPVLGGDFNYTLSNNTKLKLNNFVNVTKKYIEENITTLSNEIYSHYSGKYEIYQNMTSPSLQSLKNNLQTIANISKQMKADLDILLTTASYLENDENNQGIVQDIKYIQFNMNVNLSESIMEHISSLTHFLTFVDEAWDSKCELNKLTLKQAVENTANKLQQTMGDIEKLNLKLEAMLKLVLHSVLTKLKEQFENHVWTFFDLQKLLRETKSLRNSLSQVLSDPIINIQKLENSLLANRLDLPTQIYTNMEDENYKAILKHELADFAAYMKEFELWYKFMNKMYNTLSSYEIQGKKKSREDCSALIQNLTSNVGRKVRLTPNFRYLKNCDAHLYDEVYPYIENFTITAQRVKFIEFVVNNTLIDNKQFYRCDGEYLTVKGRFLRISNLILSHCNQSVKYLQIFASDTLYINKDLDFTGLNMQVSIMSPIWVVVGKRKIILDGSAGLEIYPKKASTGHDGIPGNPGGNAGNFIGYGDKFVNDENLYISVNGGKGGDGQDGGNGRNGVDGVVPDLLKNVTTAAESKSNYEYWKKKNFIINLDNLKSCDTIGYCRTYIVSGTRCTDGGNGRQGGSGGAGGAAGTVRVFSNPFKISAVKGKDGNNGSPGNAGKAGHYWGLIWVQEYRKKLKGSSIVHVFDKYHVDERNCRNGRLVFSQNSEGRRDAPPKPTSINPATIFDQYRVYLQGKLKSTLCSSYLVHLIQNLKEAITLSGYIGI